MGLLKPDEGSIKIEGKEIVGINEDKVKAIATISKGVSLLVGIAQKVL